MKVLFCLAALLLTHLTHAKLIYELDNATLLGVPEELSETSFQMGFSVSSDRDEWLFVHAFDSNGPGYKNKQITNAVIGSLLVFRRNTDSNNYTFTQSLIPDNHFSSSAYGRLSQFINGTLIVSYEGYNAGTIEGSDENGWYICKNCGTNGGTRVNSNTGGTTYQTVKIACDTLQNTYYPNKDLSFISFWSQRGDYKCGFSETYKFGTTLIYLDTVHSYLYNGNTHAGAVDIYHLNYTTGLFEQKQRIIEESPRPFAYFGRLFSLIDEKHLLVHSNRLNMPTDGENIWTSEHGTYTYPIYLYTREDPTKDFVFNRIVFESTNKIYFLNAGDNEVIISSQSVRTKFQYILRDEMTELWDFDTVHEFDYTSEMLNYNDFMIISDVVFVPGGRRVFIVSDHFQSSTDTYSNTGAIFYLERTEAGFQYIQTIRSVLEPIATNQFFGIVSAASSDYLLAGEYLPEARLTLFTYDPSNNTWNFQNNSWFNSVKEIAGQSLQVNLQKNPILIDEHNIIFGQPSLSIDTYTKSGAILKVPVKPPHYCYGKSTNCNNGEICSALDSGICVEAPTCSKHLDCVPYMFAGRLAFCNNATGLCEDRYEGGTCETETECEFRIKKARLRASKIGTFQTTVSNPNVELIRHASEMLSAMIKSNSSDVEVLLYGSESASLTSSLLDAIMLDRNIDAERATLLLQEYINSLLCPWDYGSLCNTTISYERNTRRALQSSSSISVKFMYEINAEAYKLLLDGDQNLDFSDGSAFELALSNMLGIDTSEVTIIPGDSSIAIEVFVKEETDENGNPIEDSTADEILTIAEKLKNVTEIVYNNTGLDDDDIETSDIDLCANTNCNGRGTCNPESGICACTSTDYWGVRCETLVTCLNGGTKESDAAYCNCLFPYYGKRCQIEKECVCPV